ncbi:efflux RND transporter periplasmic adaptor subunit [Melioribacteraceae bacterium 4301-Me]|uniref:efflux RND transporter periplasmic adaptor subunit n=1 Tax=Pyranulibacter aquaticus TaxID=3163344 RepID=UPI00359A0784
MRKSILRSRLFRFASLTFWQAHNNNTGLSLQRRNPKQSQNFLLLITLLILLIFIVSCSSDTKTTQTEILGTPVKVANPSKASLTEYMSFNANTVFLKKEIVRSTFQGFIQKVYKNIGDYIKAGDVVFQIITKEAYATDSLRVKLSDEVFSGIVNIKSKTSGILTELNYNVGDFVSDGEQLAVISNPNSLAVLLNVPYQHISKIKLKSSCILIFPNGKKVEGIIAKSLPSVDPVSQTQTFLIDFNDGNIIPENLNLEVKISINVIKNAVVLPKSAIQTNETLTNFWIMKMINDSTAVRTKIIKGIENDSLVQIINPKLSLTDKIIIDGAYGLPDTAKVIVK